MYKIPKGYVYFVTFEDSINRLKNPFLKIGVAQNIKKRLSSLQIGCPLRLTLVGYLEAKDPKGLEQYLLRLFSKDRISGEWVRLNSEIIKFIKTYNLVVDRFDYLFNDISVDKKDAEIAALVQEVGRLKHREAELISRLNEKGRVKKASKPRSKEPLPKSRKIYQYHNWLAELENETGRASRIDDQHKASPIRGSTFSTKRNSHRVRHKISKHRRNNDE